MTTTYTLTDGEGTLTIEATDLSDAKRQAREWATEFYRNSEDGRAGGAVWADVQITRAGEDEPCEEVTVQVDLDGPRCDRRSGHEWTEYSVRGNGGGVLTIERCAHCRWERCTDTWAQRPANGVQGYTVTTYQLRDDAE